MSKCKKFIKVSLSIGSDFIKRSSELLNLDVEVGENDILVNKCYIDRNLIYVNSKQNNLEENYFEMQDIVPLQAKGNG